MAALRAIACVVLAAGKGTRMVSDRPKVLHGFAGRSMLGHVLAACEALDPVRRAIVIGPGMDAVAQAAAGWQPSLQLDQAGTGDAVRAALPALAGFDGTVLVAYGDTPLVTSATLARLVAAVGSGAGAAVAVLGMRPAVPGGYGRLILDGAGGLDAIVEAADLARAGHGDGAHLAICNAGLMAIDGARLAPLLAELSNDNAKGEYYLTDLVALARARGWAANAVEAPAAEVLGVNSRAELAQAHGLYQDRLRAAAMAAGATLLDPASTFFSFDTVLGRDVVVDPHVVFGPGVAGGDRVHIRAFSHLEGTRVAAGAVIGPYARLRPGAVVGAGAHIGNFVELKNTEMGAGAKANHLAYLGDARVGEGANIGAGTITCNYDGVFKHRTEIGAGAFIGTNSSLVAPVTIGDRAATGAGSVITRDVAPDALAVGRADQIERPGAATRARERKLAEKAERKG